MRLLLSHQARTALLKNRQSREKEALMNALDAIAASPLRGANIKHLVHVPDGFRKRVGRYRILYTVHEKVRTVRVWIIAMEKDTKKDYDRWMKYILESLR